MRRSYHFESADAAGERLTISETGSNLVHIIIDDGNDLPASITIPQAEWEALQALRLGFPDEVIPPDVAMPY